MKCFSEVDSHNNFQSSLEDMNIYILHKRKSSRYSKVFFNDYFIVISKEESMFFKLNMNIY